MRLIQNPKYDLSPIDKLFYDIFNAYPSKEGQSYELLVGAVLKIIDKDKTIIWDHKNRGLYDQNLYQIDVGIYEQENTPKTMVEAKDYTKRNAKVSRPDVDKVAGSLIELDFENGYFFSATDFTRDAKKKSIGSKINPAAKKIHLFHLRPSVINDRENRVQEITVNLNVWKLDEENTTLAPKLSDEDYEIFTSILDVQNIKTSNEFYYDGEGVKCTTHILGKSDEIIGEIYFEKHLGTSIISLANKNNSSISGVWEVDNAYMKLDDKIFDVKQIAYKISTKKVTNSISIKAEGQPVLLVKSEDNSVNTLITDNQLKGITFEDNGEISFDNSTP